MSDCTHGRRRSNCEICIMRGTLYAVKSYLYNRNPTRDDYIKILGLVSRAIRYRNNDHNNPENIGMIGWTEVMEDKR